MVLKKLNDVIKNVSGSRCGFFYALQGVDFAVGVDKFYEHFKWSDEIVTDLTRQSQGEISSISYLDDEYLDNISGELYASPLLMRATDTNGEIKQVNQWRNILTIAYIKYKNKWDRLWDITKAQYNPIENYSMTEDVTETQTTDVTTTQKQATDVTTTQNEATDTTLTTNTNEDAIVETKEQGFNSTDYVPKTKVETTRNGEDNESTQHVTGLAKDNETTTHVTGLANDNVTETQIVGDADNNVKTISHSRSGNIGVTTSQQMIESEIKLWQWNFIQDVIYKDLNELITLDVYASEI